MYNSNLTGAFIDQQLTDKLITPLGGIAIKMINDTGAPSVKGSVVSSSLTVENAFRLQVVEFDVIGIAYEDGIADGQETWVIISGIAEVLLTDATASTVGNWVYADAPDGRANATLTQPPGGTISALENHFKEIGHCIETKIAGTDVLAKIVTHFN